MAKAKRYDSGGSILDRMRDDMTKAYKDTDAAYKHMESMEKSYNPPPKMSAGAGAGRGGQGGPTAKQADQNKGMMSATEKAVREQQDFDMYAKERPEQKYAKGGKVSSASSRADGCATKGKTRGKVL